MAISVRDIKNKALTGRGDHLRTEGDPDQTAYHMNLSGESIGPLPAYYKADPTTEVLVVSDDISLPPALIRVRKKGSAGGKWPEKYYPSSGYRKFPESKDRSRGKNPRGMTWQIMFWGILTDRSSR